MRKILGAVVAAAALFTATGANAQVATQDIEIDATVTGFCTVNGVAAGVDDTATINTTASGDVVVAAVTPNNSPYANVACNGPADISLSSANSGLTTAAVAPVGFEDVINYTATADWGGVQATINTATNTDTPDSTAGANSGNLDVLITPIANTDPLIVGTYNDTLTVTLTPQ
jgi:hypothetical protein